MFLIQQDTCIVHPLPVDCLSGRFSEVSLNSIEDTFALLYLAKCLGSTQNSEEIMELISELGYKSAQGYETTH